MAAPDGRSEPGCTYCGAMIEEGWVLDEGGARPLSWISGPVQRGMFGGLKNFSMQKYESVAYRCVDCGHLEFFVPNAGSPSTSTPPGSIA